VSPVYVNYPFLGTVLQNSKITTPPANTFLASSTLNDMFRHFEQLGYLDFYTLIKLSVILPHGVYKITRSVSQQKLIVFF
jgi:hypothetical protein